MNEISIKIAFFLVCGVIYIFAQRHWRKTAFIAVNKWCESHGLNACPEIPTKFEMGRPAYVFKTIEKGGRRYLYKFELSNGWLSLLSRTPLSWHVELLSKEVLRDKGLGSY